jgi:3-carboxy-cis,cis-muconate cycloisomerase
MDLFAQAKAQGIQTEFLDGQGNRRVTDAAALKIILDALPPQVPGSLDESLAALEADHEYLLAGGVFSQDVIDTGLVLQARRALQAIGDDLDRIDTALNALAREHAGTVMTARTLLQHALPTTFGLKAAGWLASIREARATLDSAGAALAPQLGGAAGTLAAFDGQGLALSRALAAELGLDAAPPWHARRERIAMLGSALALLCGTLGKAALDLTLMMQTEVGEAFESAAEGKGGSSAMPHKRNPVALVAASAAARRAPGLAATLFSAMAQEHERAAGAWHAEWETLPELFRVAAGSAARMAETFEGLDLDPARMRANLDLTSGLAFAEAAAQALTGGLGRAEAHERVRAASAEALQSGRHLRAVLEADLECVRLIGDRMDTIFDPAARLKEVRRLIGALLEDETF